jgi:hypothetical protein
MYVNPLYAERELPVLHERGGDDGRTIAATMVDYPYVSQEPRGDR